MRLHIHAPRWSGFLLLFLALPARAEAPDPLVQVRHLYLAAVESEAAIPQGLLAIEQLRAAERAPAGSALDAVLTAYHGAFITLRAKHGSWPPARLRHLREGLVLMDQAVREQPDGAEVRYLRLMSCYYLPGLLGRGWSVREDFTVLARLLPAVRDAYPGELYRAIVRFVLEEGKLATRERLPLERALDSSGDE